MVNNIKKQRGRPKKNQNILLIMDALETHERLRIQGEMNRNSAIQATVYELKNRHTNEKISQTTIKNILSKFQPENEFMFAQAGSTQDKAGVFSVTKIKQMATPEHVLIDPSLEGKEMTFYRLSHKPRPNYQKRGRQQSRSNLKFGKKKT